jgi:iron(III) transport system permease protein
MKLRFKVNPITFFWILIVGILVAPILLFLLNAVSPRSLSQGDAWFTIQPFRDIAHGQFAQGLVNSFILGVLVALLSAFLATIIAWIVLRTNSPVRKIWPFFVFALLLAPSYLIALGWQRLIEQRGVLDILGFPSAGLRNIFYGPIGVFIVLAVKGLPFAYLVISNAMRSLGGEFEDAIRVHGGSRIEAFKTMATLLSPAIWSAIAIVFAESISDFGVAATFSSESHFPIATYSLYLAIENFPANYPVGAAVGAVLLLLIVIALLLQARNLRGRSFRTLSGKTRPFRRIELTKRGKFITSTIVLVILAVTLGVPAFGALSASALSGVGSPFSAHAWTLSNYKSVVTSATLHDPLIFSSKIALIVAVFAAFLAAFVARLLTQKKAGVGSQILDFILLAAVALPGIVFAAGYIFAYNLPLTNSLGIHLYGTSALLGLAYLAGALPSTSRSLVGNMSQLQESLSEACRVHGSNAIRTWFDVVMPIIAKPLLAAFCLTYAGTLLELPVSQLLYAPGQEPLSVGIDKALANYDYGGGTAMEVLGIMSALVVVAVAYSLFNLLAPAGWKRIGASREL